jgi:hypothetical protein
MTKFKKGDKVRVIDTPENAKHRLGQTGIAKQPQGFGYADDDVMVWFDRGGRGAFKEHQLEKAA